MGKVDNETGSTELVVQHSEPSMELSVEEIGHRLDNIQKLQRENMKAGIDYGVIPGTGKKPTLLKAGAEKLCVLFRLDPQFETTKIEHDGHITIETRCVIYHQVSGQRLGSATAECSSRESKYAYRKAARTCPECGKEAIIKGKAEYGGGWLCFKKKDGCGAKFAEDDKAITGQPVGRVPNPDLPDEFPTVRRMAEKRGLIAAVRLVTGASAIFDEPMTDAKDADDDPADTFHASGDDVQSPEDGTFTEAWQDELAAHQPPKEPDAGVKATRIALIKKAKDKLGDKMGMTWLTEATREMGKTSDKLTIDDMLSLSERLTKLKPVEGARA